MDTQQKKQLLVQVMTLSGATFVLPIVDIRRVTVGDAKIMLGLLAGGGFPVSSQRLIYCGRELADDARTLGSFGIQHETTLHLVDTRALAIGCGGGGSGEGLGSGGGVAAAPAGSGGGPLVQPEVERTSAAAGGGAGAPSEHPGFDACRAGEGGGGGASGAWAAAAAGGGPVDPQCKGDQLARGGTNAHATAVHADILGCRVNTRRRLIPCWLRVCVVGVCVYVAVCAGLNKAHDETKLLQAVREYQRDEETTAILLLRMLQEEMQHRLHTEGAATTCTSEGGAEARKEVSQRDQDLGAAVSKENMAHEAKLQQHEETRAPREEMRRLHTEGAAARNSEVAATTCKEATQRDDEALRAYLAAVRVEVTRLSNADEAGMHQHNDGEAALLHNDELHALREEMQHLHTEGAAATARIISATTRTEGTTQRYGALRADIAALRAEMGRKKSAHEAAQRDGIAALRAEMEAVRKEAHCSSIQRLVESDSGKRCR